MIDPLLCALTVASQYPLGFGAASIPLAWLSNSRNKLCRLAMVTSFQPANRRTTFCVLQRRSNSFISCTAVEKD
ncbi:hypothetical protein MSG28_008839 [Choristoneura fumiferana]|uniref:Uncharacterized protein n=1 Tax=Choristoneura fumiferana TaxID=7141 RepID=A0ACC0J884_CHOFU|nr:hypothetical protein MSG28_008839 [Choristoneura fumiferana]